MVKTIFSSIFFVVASYASSYENTCVKCHTKLPVEIDKFFYRYLLKYSSEKRVKESLSEYLQNPSEEKSVMPESFIARFGIKEKSVLTQKELQEAIDIYWERYKVFGKLK